MHASRARVTNGTGPLVTTAKHATAFRAASPRRNPGPRADRVVDWSRAPPDLRERRPEFAIGPRECALQCRCYGKRLQPLGGLACVGERSRPPPGRGAPAVTLGLCVCQPRRELSKTPTREASWRHSSPPEGRGQSSSHSRARSSAVAELRPRETRPSVKSANASAKQKAWSLTDWQRSLC